MNRALILGVCLAALPASAFDLEKLIDRQIERQTESAKRETIETLARDRDPAARVKAAERLAVHTEPEAIAALAGALSDRDATVRLAAASALWRMEKAAEPARPQLLAALDDASLDVVARAAGALQSLGMKEAELATARKRVLASPDAALDSRFLVARNLLGHEPPVRLLEPMVAYLERATRYSTGSGNDTNQHNIELAEKALERLVKNSKDRALIAPLVEALSATKTGQVVLIKTLAAFEPKPEGWTQVLLGQVDAPLPHVRVAALRHLRDVKQEKEVAVWVPRAAAMLRDPDASVRASAASALGSAAGLAAGEIDKVVAALGDPEKTVRRVAANAIGYIGESNQAIAAASKARVASLAAPALTAAMEKDEDADVRTEAQRALAKIGAETRLATVAPPSGGAESSGLAVLRGRKIPFEEHYFARALTEMDVEVVRAFLDAGRSPLAPVAGMGSPIRAMIFSGRACAPGQRPTKPQALVLVKLLLERGADVNAVDDNGNTPLMAAAGAGCDRELTRALIKAGAKINAVNSGGFTPFEAGLWMGHDGLEELVAAGYRLPPEKVKVYLEGYKDRPEAQAMVRKAARK